jgi:hypothetical protein
MVLAEAMACGVPAVTYDSSPGVREIVQHSVNGVVVPVGHVRGLSEALAAPMTDEPRRLAMASAARLSSARYRREGILDRWEDLIARVRRDDDRSSGTLLTSACPSGHLVLPESPDRVALPSGPARDAMVGWRRDPPPGSVRFGAAAIATVPHPLPSLRTPRSRAGRRCALGRR